LSFRRRNAAFRFGLFAIAIIGRPFECKRDRPSRGGPVPRNKTAPGNTPRRQIENTVKSKRDNAVCIAAMKAIRYRTQAGRSAA
jgi:hypothetical protein